MSGATCPQPTETYLQNTSVADLSSAAWKKMSWSLILYIFVTIVIGLTVLRYLSASDRWLSAVIFLILSILIFVFYGLRWFTGDQSRFNYSGTWPPVINMCPDYLVYKKIGNDNVCVDMLGVSTGSGLTQFTQADDKSPPPVFGTTGNPNTINPKYFQPVIFPTSDTNARGAACAAASAKGYTWEGITNGESCTYA
jgi:hypothetical protein